MKDMELMKNAVEYTAPQVEVIEVEVEKGFAVSGEDEVGGDVDDMPIN